MLNVEAGGHVIRVQGRSHYEQQSFNRAYIIPPKPCSDFL